MWFTIEIYSLGVAIKVDCIELDVGGQKGCAMYNSLEDADGYIWSPVVEGLQACIELNSTTVELYIYEHGNVYEAIFHGAFPRPAE